MAEAGRPVVVVNPRHARDFAKATDQLATTHPLDTQGLAHVAATVRPTPRPLPEVQARTLRALLTRRRQLVPRLTAARRRLQRAPQRIRADIQAHLAWLERRVARTDDDLAAALRSSPLWRATDELLQSTPGVGPMRSRLWVAEVPELGLLNRQEIATLIGVAPFNYDSGPLRGQRLVWGGRAHVRAVLSMSTLSAVRHNPIDQTSHLLASKNGLDLLTTKTVAHPGPLLLGEGTDGASWTASTCSLALRPGVRARIGVQWRRVMLRTSRWD